MSPRRKKGAKRTGRKDAYLELYGMIYRKIQNIGVHSTINCHKGQSYRYHSGQESYTPPKVEYIWRLATIWSKMGHFAEYNEMSYSCDVGMPLAPQPIAKSEMLIRG